MVITVAESHNHIHLSGLSFCKFKKKKFFPMSSSAGPLNRFWVRHHSRRYQSISKRLAFTVWMENFGEERSTKSRPRSSGKLKLVMKNSPTQWKPGSGHASGVENVYAAAAAAESLQSCPTLCDPIDGSPPGCPVPGILQARTLEWVAIFFSNAWKWKV